MKLIPINHTLLLSDLQASGRTDAAVIVDSGVSKQYFTKLRQKKGTDKTTMRGPTLRNIARALKTSPERYMVHANTPNNHGGTVFSKTVTMPATKNWPGQTALATETIPKELTKNGPALAVRVFLSLNPEDRAKATTALKTLGLL